MNRLALIVLVALSSSCTRSIRVPKLAGAEPQVVAISRGINSATTLAEFSTTDVRRTGDSSTNLKLSLGRLGGDTVDVTTRFDFALSMRGQRLGEVHCDGQQKGAVLRVMGYVKDETHHTFRCAGPYFALELTEGKRTELSGAGVIANTPIEVRSTNDMERGLEDFVSGFHIYSRGKWLGSFEYFYGGKAYLAPTLTGEERAAVSLLAVAITSTDQWLGKPADDNQPSAPIGFRR